jgi:phospholipid/cholesterol/gamma-HCH transport system substrate-binding protein
MGDQIKNMMVGLVMLSACAFTIALILFLKPSVGDSRKTYEVRFSNVNGIGIGTRVMFAGKPVGEVTNLIEIKDARKERADSLGRIYFYQLTLKVDSSVVIYSNDIITIQTSGLLGEKSIAIIPEEPKPGELVRPVKKEALYAESADPLETAFYQLSKVAKSMGGTFTYLQDWLEKNGDSLATAVSSFGDVMQEANQTLKQVNNSKIIANVDQGTAYFASLMKQVRDSMQELCDAKFFTNMGSIATNIAHTTGSIANAKGTLGKLIEEDDMYMQVTSLFTKADTLMNDINHYGILFHLNKTWQRQRLQQITELNALSTPAAFRSYFEQEVQDVNLALSRLSLLLEKADQSPDKERIFENKQFAKDFAEFLREVNNLSKSVKEYNEQLVEKQYKLQDAS